MFGVITPICRLMKYGLFYFIVEHYTIFYETINGNYNKNIFYSL